MIKTLIAAACAGGAIALFVLYTKPAYDGLSVVQDQIAQYNQALLKAAELQQRRQSLMSTYNSFNPADLERLNKLLPDHVDNVRLLLDLDTLAASHGLALQNVTISTAATQNSEGEEMLGPATEEYGTLSFGFGTTGTYDRFVQFLIDLERSLRIVDIHELRISPAGTEGEPTYRFDIVLRTYWLK